jgi:hypothetical protein
MGPNVLIFLWHREPPGISGHSFATCLPPVRIASPATPRELRGAETWPEAPVFRTALSPPEPCACSAPSGCLRGRPGIARPWCCPRPSGPSVHLRETIYERHVILHCCRPILLGGAEGFHLAGPSARERCHLRRQPPTWLPRLGDVHAACAPSDPADTRGCPIMRPSLDPPAEENRGILTASCERILVQYDPTSRWSRRRSSFSLPRRIAPTARSTQPHARLARRDYELMRWWSARICSSR